MSQRKIHALPSPGRLSAAGFSGLLLAESFGARAATGSTKELGRRTCIVPFGRPLRIIDGQFLKHGRSRARSTRHDSGDADATVWQATRLRTIHRPSTPADAQADQ